MTGLLLPQPDGSVYELHGTLTATLVTPPSPPGSETWVNKSAAGEPYWEFARGHPTRLIVFLHSWQANRDQVQAHPGFTQFANFALVSPDFGGPNNSADDCGSTVQTEKIKRVIDAAKVTWPAISRVVLVGYSGGGFVGLMVLSHYPDVVQAASLWSAIYDLEAWHGEADAGDLPSLQACLGVLSSSTRGEYLRRSPRWALGTAKNCTVILNSGEQDDVVPHHHRVEAHQRLKGLPGVTATLNSYPAYGHEFEAEQEALAVAQLQTLLA